MFCSNCGKEITADQKFCSVCGAENRNYATPTTIASNPQTESKDFDREAMKIYLSNILALECVIQKLSVDFDNVNNEIIKFEENNYNERFQCSERNYAWFRYDGEKDYLFFTLDKNGKYFLGLNKEILNESFEYIFNGQGTKYNGAWLPIDENWDYINNQSNYPASYAPFNLFLMIFVEPIVRSMQQKTNKNGVLEAYERFKSIAPQKYQENLKTIAPSITKRTGVEKEIEEAKSLLEKAYNINIIPKQFRNIYAIWFIYDYISTSTESLSAAFLHCDLDKIKQKLDTIIEQQKEIIINQRILMAQNAQMIEQNQQTLNKLASIEQNTERAAQYAEIASNNAEACAWIGMANYIKK